VFRITTESVVGRVSTLFHGFPGLIEGFNQFLPQEYRIRVASTPHPEVKKESTKPLPYIGHPSTSGSNPFPSNYSLSPINPSQATHPRPQRSYLGYSTGVPYKQHIGGYTPTGHHGPPKFPHTPTWATEGLSSQGMGQRYTSSQMGTLNAPYYNPPDNRGGSTILGKPSFVSSSSHVPTGLNPLGIESMAPQRKASMGMIQAVGYLRKIQVSAQYVPCLPYHHFLLQGTFLQAT
jgi:histone deacetylase complex regulatory component SIN3